MLRRLVLLRHGHADSHSDDFERELTREGRLAAEAAGAALATSTFKPDVVLASPAPRALVTAEIVARACEFGRNISTDRELYLATEHQYMNALRALGSEVQVLLVGHNPGLSGLARRLDRRSSGLAPAEYTDLELATWDALGRSRRP